MAHGDKRKSNRVPFVLDVKYWVGTQERVDVYEVRAVNICEDGIFLKTDLPLALGTEVALEFSLPDNSFTMRVTGQVVWTGVTKDVHGNVLKGKGIWFTECSDECRLKLRNFVDAYSEK